jgi:hypothetical protein
MREGGGVRFTWIRRTRRDGDSWSVEVPLAEDSESYLLEVLSGGAVVRSIASATASLLYTNAMELSDFGGTQSALTIRLTQMSSTVGRGHPAIFTLTV